MHTGNVCLVLPAILRRHVWAWKLVRGWDKAAWHNEIRKFSKDGNRNVANQLKWTKCHRLEKKEDPYEKTLHLLYDSEHIVHPRYPSCLPLSTCCQKFITGNKMLYTCPNKR